MDILDTTQMTWSTLFGRHFAAYRTVRGSHHRRLTPKLWRELRRAKSVKNQDDRLIRRKLNEKRFSALVELLGLSG